MWGMELPDIILLIMILFSIFFDVTQKKIPNLVTFPAILFGLALYTFTGSVDGLWFSFLGVLLGIVLLIIPFAAGGMGGGDVKLLGAVGALQGAVFVLYAALYMAIWGGLIALLYILYNRQLLYKLKILAGRLLVPVLNAIILRFSHPYLGRLAQFFSNTEAKPEVKPLSIPYGVAIGLGAVQALFIQV